MKSGSKQEAGKAEVRIRKQNPTAKLALDSVKSKRSYKAQTLKLLWGRAAGRCAMPDCRIELYAEGEDYDPVCVIGEMGHIAASSNAGPRANAKLTSRERDCYQNLILLCRNCHRKIDVLQGRYPSDRLLELRTNHEAWVRTALPERGYSCHVWNVLLLQGEFSFDPSTLAEALVPDQAEGETILRISPSSTAWTSIQANIRTTIQSLIGGADPVKSRFALFPLAPVSACIYTGFLLTNRLNVQSFQYHRDASSWVWPAAEIATSPSITHSVQSDSSAAAVFFLFDLTAPIEPSALLDSIYGDKAIYRCSVPDPGTAWLQQKSQLNELARKAREMFEAASVRYPSSVSWHVLYAGPAPGAVAIGQQLNPTMIPEVQLYEYQRPHHIASMKITAANSPLTDWTAR